MNTLNWENAQHENVWSNYYSLTKIIIKKQKQKFRIFFRLFGQQITVLIGKSTSYTK